VSEQRSSSPVNSSIEQFVYNVGESFEQVNGVEIKRGRRISTDFLARL